MIEIREAEHTQLVHLAEIYSAARITAGCFSKPTADARQLKVLVEGEDIFVAELDGEVVGFVSVWAADNFIHHLYVLPSAQGKGVGSGLLEICTREYGHPLSLKCEVKNVQAQRFYRNKGWFSREDGEGDDGAWERLYSAMHIE